MKGLWSLYNKEDKLRVDDLTADQVKTIFLAIPTARMKDWFACRGGDVHWNAISEIPEFYEEVRALKGVTQAGVGAAATPAAQAAEKVAAPMRRPMFEEHADPTLPTLAVENVQSRERRSARRYQCRLEFKVIQGGKAFESETKDVSMTGMALKDGLPEWIPKTFRAQVCHNGQVLSIVAARVEKADTSRLRILEAESWEVLRRWIVNW